MIFLFLPHVCSFSIEKNICGFCTNQLFGFWPCFSVQVIKKIESKSMHHTNANDSGPGPRQPLLPQRCTVLIRYAAVQKQMKTYNNFLHKLHKHTQSLRLTKKIQKGTINRTYASNVPVVLALKLYQHRPQIAKNIFSISVLSMKRTVQRLQEAQDSFSGFFLLDAIAVQGHAPRPPPKLASHWHPTIAHYNGTLQWHHVHSPKVGHHPSPQP